jgi:hypothetical protein
LFSYIKGRIEAEMYENRALRKIFGPKGEEVKVWKKTA